MKQFLLETFDAIKDLLGLVACIWALWFVVKIAVWSAHVISLVLDYVAP